MLFCFPKLVIVALKTPEGDPLKLENVLLKIQTFATYRNSISLFPFATDSNGIAHITNKEMRAEVSATYDSGAMDYSAIESAHDSVEIILASQSEIEKAVSARTDTWKTLLKGEKERWGKIGDLISLYKSSANHSLEIPQTLSARPKIRDSWIRADAEYNYEIHVRPKV